MARYTGPKFRLDRREGTNLQLKGKRSASQKHPLNKKGAVPPGQHGQKGTGRKTSDYGTQLREKQKVKRMYGILERQFRRYYEKASKKKGATGEALLQLLEARLDNIVYRLGFAASRAQARQLTSHGHVLVNGKKVNIPSYSVQTGDVISLKDKANNFLLVKEASAEIDKDKLPEWLEKKALVGKLNRLPAREEIAAEINEQAIVEFYSR
ncbi:MAG TPA: 30S ribosomal protein S4 [Candidatus Saccharimonadales bacterium]|nr:30S ribosomal protein S4 [Candidatus Saccharimonadales bacterium]